MVLGTYEKWDYVDSYITNFYNVSITDDIILKLKIDFAPNSVSIDIEYDKIIFIDSFGNKGSIFSLIYLDKIINDKVS